MSVTTTTVGGGAKYASTSKIMFAPAFKRRFRDLALITKLTNSEWKGQFKGTGTELKVPCLPIISTKKRRKGETVVYQNPENWDETFIIDRERDFAFQVQDEDRLFSYLNLDGEFASEGMRTAATDMDIEFFADIYSKGHAKNMGNTAGFQSGAYKLGTALDPLYVYEDKADAALDSTSGRKKAAVTKALTSMISALQEQPGGSDTKPFIVIPNLIANVMQNSPLSKADEMGDTASVLRKSVQYLGEISGAAVWVCNNLPIIAGETIGATTYPDRHVCLFGDTSAVTFADEVTVNETLRDKDAYGNFHRTLFVYDWFVRYPERLGSAVLAVA